MIHLQYSKSQANLQEEICENYRQKLGNIFKELHILEKSAEGGDKMEPVAVPHGDIDDLIYREEWTASDR